MGRAVLGLRNQERPRFPVDMFPFHSGDLGSTHHGFDGDGDHGTYIATVDIRSGQQAGLLITYEATVTALWEFLGR